MHPWVPRLESLTRFAKSAADEPLCFIIGAGASLSSGGPTTTRVEEALLGYNHFDGVEQLRAKVHDLTEKMKSGAIVPLFKDFAPYLGYYALASIAHRRRVLVLNLNWDMAVERACELVGVKYASADIREVKKIRQALSDPAVQLICVHLHGTLENEQLRFGRLETLSFSNQQTKLLQHDFLTHPIVIIGATLRGDADMVSLLQQITRDNRDVNPVWLLTRDESVLRDGELRRMLIARKSEPNTVHDESLDFDRAMVWINAELSGFTLQSFIAAGELIEMPDYNEVILPRPDVLRPHLDKSTIILQGEPRLGKTTIANFLAFFFHSLQPDPCREDPATGRSIRPYCATRPRACASTLAGVRRPDAVIVLEDPFGDTERFEPNPKFLRALHTRRSRGGAGRTIVTTRPSTWNDGLKEWAGKQRQRALFDGNGVPENIGMVTEADEWYAMEDLKRLVPPERHDVAQRVRQGDLNTPARVKDELAGETGFAADRKRVVVQEKVETLRRYGANVQRVAALLRLQEMSSHPRTWDRICEDAALLEPQDLKSRLSSFVRFIEWDQREYARLKHPTYVEAVDVLLDEPRSSLLADLRNVALYVPWVATALRIRTAIRAAEQARGADSVATLSEDEIAEWAPTFLAVSAQPENLEPLSPRMDLLALRDYVYEVVRLWEHLQESEAARKYLNDLLADRNRQGVYAVLEAALYLQFMTDAEIWSRLETEFWNLFAERGKHPKDIALVFDALLWRDAPEPRLLHAADWVRRMLRNADPTDQVRGALAFSLVFHANEARAYLQDADADALTLDLLRTLNADQAKMFCWMLEWHFLHECRDRALVQRRAQLLDEFERYLRRTPAEHEASPGDRALMRVACEKLADLGHPGAAFLLAMRVSAIRGDLGMGAEMRKLLTRAKPDDLHVILAMMTFSKLPADVIPDARAFFSRPASREALLDAFAHGVELDGVRIQWPRFDACRDAFAVMDMLHVRWPEIDRLGPPLHERAAFVGWLKAWQHSMSVEANDFRRFVKRVGRGDLRPLVAAVLQTEKAGSSKDWPERVIARAVEIVRNDAIRRGEILAVAPATPIVDLDWYRRQLHEAKAAGERPRIHSAIEAILALPYVTRDQQRLRAEALLLHARYALIADRPRPRVALDSAREARHILQSHGESLSPEDEQIHKSALIHELAPGIGASEKKELFSKAVEVLEKAAERIKKQGRGMTRRRFAYPNTEAARSSATKVLRIVSDVERGVQLKAKKQPLRVVAATRVGSHELPESAHLVSIAATPLLDVEAIASKYLEGVTTPPTALQELFPRLHIKGAQEVAAIDNSGELRQESDGLRIVYATNESPGRVNFTKAHEVAHAIAKAELPNIQIKKYELERFCDSLAAALLMPKALFRDALGTPVTLAHLKSAAMKFLVSLHAASIRCEELTGCLSFHIEDGRVVWATRSVPSRLPMLRDLVRDILGGLTQPDPIFMTTKRYSGYWTVEFEKHGNACTVFLRPLPLGHTMDRPPVFA